MIQPSRRVRRSDKLLRFLRDSIANGQFPGGSQLPATRQLATQFNLSQPTVQQVMKRLLNEGLIECQQGRRNTVKPGARRGMGHQAMQIGLIIQRDFTSVDPDNWLTCVVSAAENILAEEGYCTVRMPLENDRPGEFEKVLGQLDRYSDEMAGVLTINVVADEKLLAALDDRKLPWMVVNRPHELATSNFVEADNLTGGRLLGRILAHMDIERFLIISIDLNLAATTLTKVTGLYHGLLLEIDHMMPHIDRVTSDPNPTEEAGFKAMHQYLEAHPAPQVVFTSGDLLALGVIQACRKKGLRVPEDVGVIGTTGLQVGQYSEPSLTILEQPMEQMGQQAALMLLKMIREKKMRVPGILIPSRLIVRNSMLIPEELYQRMEPDQLPIQTILL